MTDQPTNQSNDDVIPPLDETLKLLGQESQHGASPDKVETGSIIPAGHAPPTPSSLDDIGIAHAIDGDGTALCRPDLRLAQVDDYYWSDVPSEQRCLLCAATLDA